MPYNAGWKPDEEKMAMKPGQLPAGMPASPWAPSSGTAPLPTSSAGTGGGPVGNFVNFGTWFGLNQQKAGQMANTVAGGVQKQGDAATKALDQAQNTFNQNVGANTLEYKAPGSSSKPAAPGSSAKAAAAPPGAITPAETQARTQQMQQAKAAATPAAPQNVFAGAQASGDVSKLGAASYQGPKSLNEGPGWGDMMKGAQKAQDAAAQTGTEEGRQALVQQTYGGPQGTYGSALDAGLANVAGANQFGDLRQQYGNLAQRFTDADAASQAAAGRAAGDTSDAAAQYRGYADQQQQNAAKGASMLRQPGSAAEIAAETGSGGTAQGATPTSAQTASDFRGAMGSMPRDEHDKWIKRINEVGIDQATSEWSAAQNKGGA